MNCDIRLLISRPTLLALALMAASAYLPAHAGDTCELSDGDPSQENAGGSVATETNGVACGIFNVALAERSIAVGAGNRASGIGSSAFGNVTIASGESSVAFGSFFDANGSGTPDLDIDTDQDGENDASSELTTALGDHSTAIGPGAWSVGDRSVGLGAGAFAAGADSIAIGSGSRADEANTVSVGSAGNERRIVNVAAGEKATDAVNVSQLESTLNTAKAYTDDRETAIRQDMEAGDAQTLSAANDYTDKKFADLGFSGINDRFAEVDRRIGHLGSRLDRVGALGAAMVGMASSAAAVEGGRTRIGIAAGAYGGKQALSVGLQQRLSARAALTIGGAFSGSERSATVGVGFGF